MSGMTGYDQATSYPTSQYNYVPNLQSPVDNASVVGGVDPRQLHGGWGSAQAHAHYAQMQGSPGGLEAVGSAAGTAQHHRGYPYYDRNGYYVHQQHGGGAFDSWHDPSLRPDSPTSAAVCHNAPPSYPSPAVSSSATVGSANYSCKMAVQPPALSAGATPPSPTHPQQKTNDNPQQPQLQPQYGGGGQQYGGPPCPLTQNSQQPPGVASGGYNNNLQPVVTPGGGIPPPGHHPPNQVGHNSYSLSGSDGGGVGAHVGEHSPVHPQPPGAGQNQPAPQASLPSPLYPWMRSQFGKTLDFL
jgi:hypothetical protein